MHHCQEIFIMHNKTLVNTPFMNGSLDKSMPDVSASSTRWEPGPDRCNTMLSIEYRLARTQSRTQHLAER